jgi:uncharacterized membrane protein YfcA
MIILATIIIFVTLTHTLFGAGILTLGTPIMLILGYNFTEISTTLLPISFFISLKIVKQDFSELKNEKIIRYFILYTLPLGILFSYLSFSIKSPPILKFIVCLFLFIVGLTRLSGKYHHYFSQMIKKIGFISYPLIGATQGFTNMGGALLIPLIASMELPKKKSRAIFSFFFALFAGTQLIILKITGNGIISVELFIFLAIALVTNIFCEKFLFHRLKAQTYFHLLTALILINAFILLTQYLNLI